MGVTGQPGSSRLTDDSRRVARLVVIAVGLVFIGFAGYLGFVWFVEADPGAGAGILVVGGLTGFAAFFSPCSFPLLLTFLARQADGSRSGAIASAMRVGGGAAAFLAVLGGLALAGAAALGTAVTFDSGPGRGLRFAVGALLLFLGLRQARIVRLRFGWLDRVAGTAARELDPARARNRVSSDVLYGFGYLLAGFG